MKQMKWQGLPEKFRKGVEIKGGGSVKKKSQKERVKEEELSIGATRS